MAIELQRPARIRLRRGRSARGSAIAQASPALGSAAGLLLVGAAIGILLMTSSGFGSIGFVGVLALGVTLLGEDR
jgi:hypothetical protein